MGSGCRGEDSFPSLSPQRHQRGQAGVGREGKRDDIYVIDVIDVVVNVRSPAPPQKLPLELREEGKRESKETGGIGGAYLCS